MDTLLQVWILLLFGTFSSVVHSRGPPRLVSRVIDRQLAKIGKNVRLQCPVESDPPPLLQWSKDDETIHSGWDRFKFVTNALRIKDVVEEDAGEYICKATNGFGSIDVRYRLYVVPDTNETVVPPWVEEEEKLQDAKGDGIPPSFTHPEQMRNRVLMRPVGSSVRLKCKASGKPKPSIIWFRDGQVLSDVDIHDPDEDDHSRYTLRLSSLQAEDSGKYTCKLMNRAGSINATFDIEVIDRALQKPVIMPLHPENVTTHYGGTASFQCRVISSVEPHIQWLKKVEKPSDILNTNATITVEDQQFVVLKTGEPWPRKDGTFISKLVITDTTMANSGTYICLSANSMGYTFRSAVLTVQPDPFKKSQSDESSDGGPFGGTPSLPLLIALPVGIVVIILAIALYFLVCRRQSSDVIKKNNPIVRQPRVPPPPPHPQDKYYEQYQALHQGMQQGVPQRNFKSYDVHSDISSVPRVGMSPHPHGMSPLPPGMSPVPPGMSPSQQMMLPPNMNIPPVQHQHLHYGCH